MPTPDSFQIFAEVGIGIAGFSGLTMALRRNPGPLDEIQRFRLGLLFMLAFGATFLSLLPVTLASLAVPDKRIWFDASALLLAYSIFLMWWWVSRSRQHARSAPEIFNWYVFTTMSVGHLSVISLQLIVVLGLTQERAPGIFMFGLTWYLVHAAQQFARMLFVHPKSAPSK